MASGAGVEGTFVYILAVQPDGKVMVAGQFTAVHEVSRNNIARLNADGSLDTTFDPGTGANNLVASVAVQPDGKIRITGVFTMYNDQTHNRIVRLNPDGSIDPTYAVGTGADGNLWRAFEQPHGKVIVTGDYANFNNVPRGRISRLNAVAPVPLDPGFVATGVLTNEIVYSAVPLADGKIVVGGAFTSFNGVPMGRIVRLNADGSLDSTFNPGAGVDVGTFPVTAGVYPHGLVVQPDGKILIGGPFEAVAGVSRNGVARLNANGSLDTGFDPGTGADDHTRLLDLALQTDGKVVVGGEFISFNGVSRTKLARLNANGSVDMGFNVDLDGTVRVIRVLPDNKLLIGGQFTMVNGVARKEVARLNLDGTLDTTFDPGLGIEGAFVYELAPLPDGRIMVGGNITTVDGVTRNGIARLNANGSHDTTFDAGVGANNLVANIRVQPDGKLLVSGVFTAVGGVTFNRIVRLHPNGALDGSFDPGLGTDGNAWRMAVQPDGKVIVMGQYTSFNGEAKTGIARLIVKDSAVTTPPTLKITLAAGKVTVSWAASATGYILEVADRLGSWSASTASVVTTGDQKTVEETVTGTSRYYRLKK